MLEAAAAAPMMNEDPCSRPAGVFPHRRVITVVLVLLGQDENQPPQASEAGTGERDQNPSVFEETRWASEAGDRPYDNEGNERGHVHEEPDERNVVPSEEGRAGSRLVRGRVCPGRSATGET
jgi:hypothetical protein